MTPPIPFGSPHFATHDYGDGKGSVLVFYCLEEGEPWPLSEYLSKMQRTTVSAVAESLWRAAIRKLYADFAAGGYEGEHPDIAAAEYREYVAAWRRWSNEG